MDDATGQLGNNGTEISDLVSGKNGVIFAISKVAELPPTRGGNSATDTVCFTLPSDLLLLSCWNVGNSESFPHSNRNSVDVNCPNEEWGLSLLYIHAHASAYFLISGKLSNI